MNLRALATEVMVAVVAGTSLTEALALALAKTPTPREQAFVQALCYGVCRQYFRLTAILETLMPKPLKAKDSDVHLLLLIGLHQLIDMRVPAHAAVAETVAATKKVWAKSLINAVLRNYQRQAENIQSVLKENPAAHFAHPAWLIASLQQAWPKEYENILLANNQHPPFALRVNQKKISRADYLAKLTSQTLAATIIPATQSGIELTQPLPVSAVPGFFAGEVSVQDGGAQLATELLAPVAGERILDACAAPGGKTAHILEQQPALVSLVAVDCVTSRVAAIQENLTRLQLTATVKCADVAAVHTWWDGELFDRILLDAPCSASGVVRRHPDIKLLRRPSDVPAFATEQLRLLTALWPLLRPGGLLLYVTCSIFPAENVEVILAFLAATPGASAEKITATWGVACEVGQQILPGMQGMDGFYFAGLRKCSSRR